MELIERVKCIQDDIDMVDRYCSIITKSESISDLTNLYNFVKGISYDFYDGKIDSSYYSIKKLISSSESLFSDQFLLPISFTLKKSGIITSSSNECEILDYLVNEVRKYLLSCKVGKIYKLYPRVSWDEDFANYCYIASKKTKELCDFLNIPCYVVGIWPGYDRNSKLLNDNGYHFCNIIDMDNKFFLVDTTYKQFFKLSVSNIERIGLMDYPIAKAGCFMMMSDIGRKVSSEILSNGYVELDGSIFKTYMDGFTVSFRNGLYYEETDDYSYTTNYSVYDYINFLAGYDNQVNREGKDNLGYQKRPIKM